MNHFERDFEKEFERLAPLSGMKYFKIPDFIHAKGNKIIAHKRFCDGILITPSQNFCLEFKYQYGKLKEHQEKAMQEVNAINMSYYVVRKNVLKKGDIYTIEGLFEAFLYTVGKIEDLFLFFNDPDDSQQTMLDTILPSSKRKPRMKRTLV